MYLADPENLPAICGHDRFCYRTLNSIQDSKCRQWFLKCSFLILFISLVFEYHHRVKFNTLSGHRPTPILQNLDDNRLQNGLETIIMILIQLFWGRRHFLEKMNSLSLNGKKAENIFGNENQILSHEERPIIITWYRFHQRSIRFLDNKFILSSSGWSQLQS